jgi:hypothetical protein
MERIIFKSKAFFSVEKSMGFSARPTDLVKCLLEAIFGVNIILDGLGLGDLFLEREQPTIASSLSLSEEIVLVAVELEGDLIVANCLDVLNISL